MAALVVFDTCTKPPYYADVHQLLALPTGTYLRYDYEQKLFSAEAFALLSKASSADMPIEAFLFYGQFHTYKKGEPDPKGQTFTPDDSILVPTRYAKIRNVALDHRVGGDGQPRTNVIFHMELLGFPDPDSSAIPTLMRMLSDRGELPFSKWIAAVPADLDLSGLRQDDVVLWGKAVDRLARTPSQFNGDVFWRIDHLEKINGMSFQQITPRARSTNKFGDKQFFADYPLGALGDYRITVTNIVPEAENKELPAQTTVTAMEDATKLLALPEKARELRRNDGVQFICHVNRLDEMTTKYAKLVFATTVKDHASPFPAGSSAEISISVTNSGYRLALSIVLAALGTIGLGAAAILARSEQYLGSIAAALIGVLALAAASIAYTGKIKIPGLGKD